MNASPVVLKYGSSVLTGNDALPRIVHDVYRFHRRYRHVLVVVSARDGETERLLAEARRLHESTAPGAALAELLATGEQQSAALLAVALDRAGVAAAVLTPAAIGLKLRGERLDAEPVAVDVAAIRRAFETNGVLVVPGFAGIHEAGGTALLGRGGSDLTAVFLARQLGAERCRLVKDVDGIYERDPAASSADEPPRRFASVTCDAALHASSGLVQPKALEFLRDHGAVAEVGALLHAEDTLVGAPVTATRELAPSAPRKVLLLGLGTVGQGVYRCLQDLGALFEVTGILVRDPAKTRAFQPPEALLETGIERLVARPHDVVVDACGDPDVVQRVIESSLAGGRPVVTASKQIVASSGPALERLAAGHGTAFRYAAAVGGGVPMVELLQQARRQGSIAGLRGVVNGTCNFVLDRLAGGVAFHTAVAEARRLGFAEANASRDLHGDDSADKLRILARLAFGPESDAVPIRREELTPAETGRLTGAGRDGRIVRQVASFCPRRGAFVRLESLSPDDYLAGAVGEENRLVVTMGGGQALRVSGKGAGRWPTAESVIADLFDVTGLSEADKRSVIPGVIAPATTATRSRRTPESDRTDSARRRCHG